MFGGSRRTGLNGAFVEWTWGMSLPGFGGNDIVVVVSGYWSG
jgi:hypothetical protein